MSQLEAQMRHRDKEMVPRILVLAMFGLMAASLALVAFAQLSGAPQRGVVEQSPAAVERVITFEATDRQSNYSIFDETGAEIARSSETRQGFIGVIGRVLERERTRNGVALDTPVRVVRRENGRVAIIDDATGWSVDLIGYGADNVAAFARLLED